ncbi:hypothetical protein FLJC2902T_16840 [Flavobacterium limnosediminis JC2902]|uniref:Uncharacterized protein n=1 Tax=Flavobacterium limnosediminis JC2902 TaxID=1341181 RepID=V6SNR1_9FLAO|nr:hypothetical protein FLJC2902T_16840 [Flavobacterium limnosediminis JC2902]
MNYFLFNKNSNNRFYDAEYSTNSRFNAKFCINLKLKKMLKIKKTFG